MFALAIPLAIFVLPALLTRLNCRLVPLELRDGSVFCAPVREPTDFTDEETEYDEDSKRAQTLITRVLGLGKERQMDRDRDEVMAEHPNEEVADASIEDPSGAESRTGGEDTVLEQPETNGSADTSMSALSETVSRDGGSVHRTSSRVASLRAAFEQTEKPAEAVKRRFTSEDEVSERMGDIGRERQAEITRLKVEIEKEKDLRIAFEEKISSLEEEVDELTLQLEERDEAWREEYGRRSQHERHGINERMGALAREAKQHRDEANTLQRQLFELKRSISMSTRSSTQISDNTIQDEISVLQHEIQNWLVKNFRRVKGELTADESCNRLAEAVDSNVVGKLQRIYKGFEPALKFPIYQATVASYLQDVFDDPYLFGLPCELNWVQRSREAADSLSSVLSPTSYNRWRSATFDALRQAGSVQELVQGAAQSVAEQINHTLDAVTELDADKARVASLKIIIKRAIDLAHLMRVQQAQYDIALPSPGDRYDATSMDDISEDGDADVERTVRCATFVSIVKVGDEHGDNPDLRNLLVKAKVLCNGDGNGP